MRQGILFFKVLTIIFTLMIASPGTSLYGQHRHGNPITGQGISNKKVTKKKGKEKKIKVKGRSSKKVREQAKKTEKRLKDNARADKKLKEHHFSIQTPDTQYRMKNNERMTSYKYKEKNKKIRQESHKPKKQRIQKP